MPDTTPLTAAELNGIERVAEFAAERHLPFHLPIDQTRRLVAMARRVEGLEVALREALEIAVIEQDGTKGDDPVRLWWADKANRWTAALTPTTEATDV